jgi:hypothetical protein
MKDIYWLAGIIEGEGCFSPALRAKWPEYRNPRIRIEMTDKDVICKASMILHGSIKISQNAWASKRNGHQIKYTVEVTGKPAMDWMIMLYPMMGERRQAKIKEVLAQYNHWLTVRYKHRRSTPRYMKLVS